MELKEIQESIKTLNGQMLYVTRLLETLVEQTTPCKDNTSKTESMAVLMNVLKTSPLQNHPVFKDMIKPLEEILANSKI